MIRTTTILALLALAWPAGPAAAQADKSVASMHLARNVVFILSDDHRYDFMSFHPGAPAWLETPHLDRMAREGCHFENSFVATSLCSPSRASILTGQYMHHHRVVDNQRPVPVGTVFFPRYLQRKGIQTAFVGKWHMGHQDDEPRPGFDHWVSFKGQGRYFDPVLNIDGKRQAFRGYNDDVLTTLALEWLERGRDAKRPFFLYLSFKAVHYPFQPARRNAGRYAQKKVARPETMARTERNYRSQPRWVRERRYSIHGVDHMETGPYDHDPVPDFDQLYRSYAEAVHTLDENIGRVLEYLRSSGLSEDTLVIYMSDNGFHLGEHGFYDKRDAFETSIRVPLLAWAPGRIEAGSRVEQMVQNIDIAPTILAAMGVAAPASARFDGRSWLGLPGAEEEPPWRDHILYEYHWEWNFPATPTLFAIRTASEKYIYYHGIWDRDSFHDLDNDPLERVNLIDMPSCRGRIAALRAQLFSELKASGALEVPLRTPAGERLDQRKLRR